MLIIITRLCIKSSELGVSKLLWPIFLQYLHSQPLASAILLSVSRSLVFKIFDLFLVSVTALLLALPVLIPGRWGYSEDWPGQQGSHCILVCYKITHSFCLALPCPWPACLTSVLLMRLLVYSWLFSPEQRHQLHALLWPCQRSKGWL